MGKRISLGFKMLFLLVLMIPALCLLCCIGLYLGSFPKDKKEIERSASPPAAFRESDLVGTWEANYNYCIQCVDQLILRGDGSFKQIYRDVEEEYLYEAPWNKWWVERFPDGRVRVYLEGARYYPYGIDWAEDEGIAFGKPRSYHDPFDPENRFRGVEMVGKLVLNVRVLRSGEIVLVHMWSSIDSPSWEAFRRVEGFSLPDTPVP
mgnify:FL=1|jgi:hypothetical protein